mgnify:CR=1 FL=1
MSGDASSGTAGGIPPGWYADPSGGDGQRWWDGSAWTSHVQAPLGATPLPTANQRQSMAAVPLPAVQRVNSGVEDTKAVWWIAFSPLWSIVPQAIIVSTIMALTSADPVVFIPALIVVNLLLWAVVLWMAFADHARLRAGGNPTAASPFWVLLTPLAYLIARATHVRVYASGAWSVVIWWCVATIFAPGLAVLGVFAAYGIFAV